MNAMEAGDARAASDKRQFLMILAQIASVFIFAVSTGPMTVPLSSRFFFRAGNSPLWCDLLLEIFSP
jgi:hypothetical protein